MESQSWNRLICGLPEPHILQSWEWGQVKSKYGWLVYPHAWCENGQVLTEFPVRDYPSPVVAAALILGRAIPVGGFAARMRVFYVPKGPLLSDWSSSRLRKRVLGDLAAFAHRSGGIFIKVDPDVIVGRGFTESPASLNDPRGESVIDELRKLGWRLSAEQVQFRNTVLIPLDKSEDELLRQMKQKTRYNVGLARRKGVKVRVGCMDDFEMLYRMYVETAVRDGFAIRDMAYYRTTWQTFIRNQQRLDISAMPTASHDPSLPVAEPLIAEVDDEPVAALFLFRFGGRAWYLYGMSRDRYREKMPNYLLQWEAIRRAKIAGCQVYDLWGAPDTRHENDPLWGVFRFKEGLGGDVVRHIGAWDLPLRPGLYWLYTKAVPALLCAMRSRGKRRLKRETYLAA